MALTLSELLGYECVKCDRCGQELADGDFVENFPWSKDEVARCRCGKHVTNPNGKGAAHLANHTKLKV